MTHPHREQNTREAAPLNNNHQQMPEARKENAAPTNTNGESSIAAPAGKGPTLVDISNLLTNAMLLVQQLLASLAEKNTTAGKPTEEVETKPKENTKVVAHDVPESSVQGEARWTLGMNRAPYYYRCLGRGHPKEECDVQLLCDVSESNAHVRARCPAYKKAIKSFAMTCGYVVDGLGFYYIPHAYLSRTEVTLRQP
jgi:hypothetical protein